LNNIYLSFFLIFLQICITNSSLFSESTKVSLDKHQLLVKVTYQNPNFLNPWKNKTPDIRIGVGTYIGENRLLIPASLLEYNTLIEVQSPEDSISKLAQVIKMDSEANLGLIEVKDPKDLFAKSESIQFNSNLVADTEVQVLIPDNQGEISKKRAELGKIQMETYSDGRIELPSIEISSNEALYGNGELIIGLKNKQALGILYYFNKTKNSGRMIPGKIINLFIKSKAQFPFKGFYFQPINNEVTQNYYGLKKDQSGILIAEVILDSSAYGVLQTEDVIIKIGNFKIDNQGRFNHPIYGKLPLSYIFHSGDDLGFKFGSKVPVEIIRKKKKETLSLVLKEFPESSIQIPFGNPQNYKPGYLMVGGYVFMELNEFYLKEWGRNWRSSVDKKMLYKLDYHKFRKSSKDPKRVIFISQVFPDDSNNGFHDLRQDYIQEINGKPVTDLNQLHREIEKVKEKDWIVFKLESGIEIPIPAKNLDKLNLRIMKNFQIQKTFMQPSTGFADTIDSK
jgi:hypothetical protein